MLAKQKEIIEREKEQLSKQNKDIVQQKEEIEQEYFDYIKNTSEKLLNGVATNTVTNNNSLNMNIYYVTNNYTNALNYEDLMKPALTEEEIKEIKRIGPSAGCEKLIRSRCIDGLKQEERPIHCVDASRYKFALRTNDTWMPDWGGEKILNIVHNKMREVFDVSNPTKMDPIELELRLHQLADMENTKRKAIKYIANRTQLIK